MFIFYVNLSERHITLLVIQYGQEILQSNRSGI